MSCRRSRRSGPCVVLMEVEWKFRCPKGPERSGRIAHGPRRPCVGGTLTRPRQGGLARMPTRPNPGRSLVTHQALVDLVRAATLGSYGVTGFAGAIPERLLERVGLAQPGIVVRSGAAIDIELDLTVAYGVPIAEVARQVDSAVRYA
ncbi:MAG: Asp23/Gls24 family envelope stress response protein, partial [Thermomicrobiales bacterium]